MSKAFTINMIAVFVVISIHILVGFITTLFLKGVLNMVGVILIIDPIGVLCMSGIIVLIRLLLNDLKNK